MSKEIRTLATGLEVRKQDDAQEMIVEGYALRFNTWSEDLGRFIETITPDALKNTKLEDVRLLKDHNWQDVLARQSAGNLELSVDEVGLRFKAKLPNTTLGRDLYEQIKVGNVNQCSFEFNLDVDGDEMRFDAKENIYKRTIKAIKQIREISIVSLPAYKSTDVSIALRSLEVLDAEKRQLELTALELELFKLKHK